MIHRKLGACAALFFGLALAGSAVAADTTSTPISPAAAKVSQMTPNNAQATRMLSSERVFAQMAKASHSAFAPLENDCEHVTHSNFCACYPDACHN